jgi:prepilin-type N-terminal cleavage/methylation domain-containing protein/prepilin-type processing-associated H-X9-DG protein
LRRRSAFTLIELLVVIAIIAILAAILFPVFAQAREKARGIACMSNCKQIGTSLMLYSQDYDEGFPTWSEYYYCAANPASLVPCRNSPGTDNVSRYWDAILLPYVKSGAPALKGYGGVWKCPSSGRPETERSMGINQALIYAFNPSDPYYYRYISQPEIVLPANVVFVGDGGREGRLDPPHYFQGYYDRFVAHQPYLRSAPWRHSEGGNYVFCDGHAKFSQGDRMYPHPPAPSTNYTVARPAAWCSVARNFVPKQAEIDYFNGLAASSGMNCGL